MKKTRILAALLCLMMVVCSLPMVASAATPISNELYNTIGELMGKKSSQPHNSATWSSMNFDFTNNFNQTDSITMPAGASYDNTNGLNMPKGTYSTWKYFPSNLAAQGWSPLVYGAYTARVKVDAGGKVELIACAYYQHGRSFVIINQEGVTVFSSADNATMASGQSVVPNVNNYVPGSDWNDVVVVANAGAANAANGYSVYMKKATEDEFTLVCSTGSYRSNGGWKGTGLSIAGNDAYVARAVMLEGTDTAKAPVYDSIEEIMGGPVATTHNAEFDGSFDPTAWSRQGKLTSPSNVSYSDANGLEMFDTAESATWNYYVYSGWSPFSQQAPWSAYVPQAVYFQAKGALNVQFRGPGNAGRFYIDLAPNSNIGTGGGTATEHYAVANDGGWMEFLVVPKADSTATGYSLYAKGGSTNGKWTKVATTSNWRGGGGNATGFNFFTNKQGTGAIKTVRCYAPAVAEAATIPETADYLWFNDDMDVAAPYGNVNDDAVVYANGYANFPTEEGNITYNANYAAIPVGGYAEFKTRTNGFAEYSAMDGTTSVNISLNKDYGEITGGTGYLAELNKTTWRTYRIVRSESGYSIYSKLDSDNAWLAHATNASVAGNGEIGMKFRFHTHQNGASVGSGQMDYLKIYGPAPTDTVTLTDGVGTKVVGDGDTIGYGSTLRPIITGVESGKLLLASYSGNNMVKAQILNVEDLEDQDFFAVAGSGVDTIKVFLWDGFNGLNRLAPVTTLHI